MGIMKAIIREDGSIKKSIFENGKDLRDV